MSISPREGWTVLHGMLFGAAFLLAFAGGLAGLLIGLVLPLTRWMLGAALLAFVVAFVIWFVIGWSTSPDDPMLDILKSSALLGAAFGLPMGIGFWYQARHYDRSGKWT